MKFTQYISAALVVGLIGSVHACENKERTSDPATKYVQDRCHWVGAFRCSAPNLTSLPICEEGLVLTAAATGGPSCCCPPA